MVALLVIAAVVFLVVPQAARKLRRLDRPAWTVADMCSVARTVSRHELDEACKLGKKTANRIRGENVSFFFFWKNFAKLVIGGNKQKPIHLLTIFAFRYLRSGLVSDPNRSWAHIVYSPI